MYWAWQETNVSLSKLISRLACGLDSCALPDSLVMLSTLKLRLAMDVRWAHRVRLARLLLLALQDFSLFWHEIVQILSLNHMGDTLKTTIQTKQDLYTNSYKITINWGIIQVLENVFYTKVSHIRRLKEAGAWANSKGHKWKRPIHVTSARVSWARAGGVKRKSLWYKPPKIIQIGYSRAFLISN